MRYVHTNIIAKDWRKLSAFYVKVFRCRITPPERCYQGEWLDKGLGVTGVKLEGVHLRLPGCGDNGPTLEIFTYVPQENSAKLMPNETGYSHIAFEVDEVEHTLSDVLSNGGSALGRISEKKVEGIGLLKFVYLRDPEGNIIEIQSWN